MDLFLDGLEDNTLSGACSAVEEDILMAHVSLTRMLVLRPAQNAGPGRIKPLLARPKGDSKFRSLSKIVPTLKETMSK